ncbi:MAG: indole-3-glycerol phosphate synthase TrpC, partial [bacterium]
MAAKRGEVSRRIESVPLGRLEEQLPEAGGPSFLAAVRKPGLNIIAEIKYKSPSHGAFLCQDPPVEIAAGYSEGGAAAISVLTDEKFFDGKLEYLQQVSEYFRGGGSTAAGEGERRLQVPLLRKDFIIDRYQIAEAAIAGASACLLIVAGLDSRALVELQEAGRDYSVESLV